MRMCSPTGAPPTGPCCRSPGTIPLQGSLQGGQNGFVQGRNATFGVVEIPANQCIAQGKPGIRTADKQDTTVRGSVWKPLASSATDLYGPRTMYRRSHGDLMCRAGTDRTFTWFARTAVCSLALAGCSGTVAARTGDHATSTTARSTPTPGASSQIISAWLAAEKAFDDAALTSDPNAPELEATMIPPLLASARSDLARMRADGYVARGTTDYGSPRIVSQSPRRATVSACVHDQEVEVSESMSIPAPGVLGEPSFEKFTSVLELTPDGWRLSAQTVEPSACTQ